MTVERSSADFGRKLREARERKGVSIRQVSNNTKIAATVLEALERNDISKLPTGIFGRAFVRSFALEVGLDPEASIQEFTEQFRDNLAIVPPPATEGVEDKDARERKSRRRWQTMLALIIVVLAAGVGVANYGTGDLERTWGLAVSYLQPGKKAALIDHTVSPAQPAPPPVAVQASQPPTETAAPPETSSAPASPTESASRNEATERTASDAPVDRLNVVLRVTRPCWVAATVDGEKQIQRVLRPGDDRTLDVRSELVLTLGDAGAVKMTINGMETKPLGRSGEVLTERVNLTNAKRFFAGQ